MSTNLSQQWFTPPRVARFLGVHVDKVRGWIATGELKATNLGNKTRPRWRLSSDAIESFLAARSNQTPPKATRRRRRKPDGNVIQFFK